MRARDWLLVGLVALLSISANLPGELTRQWGINRKILIVILIAVLAVTLIRYARFALVLVVAILAAGANLPESLAQELGVSRAIMLGSLIALVVLALLIQLSRLIPSDNGKTQAQTSPQGLKSLLAAVESGDIEQTEKLLALGTNINAADDHGNTALIHAARKGYSDLVHVLLLHGADPGRENRRDETALTLAMINGYTRAAHLIQQAQSRRRVGAQ